MKPFLYSVAEAYFTHEADSLIDYCFVFPNKRSAVYFSDYLATIAAEHQCRIVFPATATIVEFVDSFSEGCFAERMELIFILYGVYRGVIRERHGAKEAETVDFNRFIYWADVLLNDFDDVDNSLANVREVFRNVENLKEISANYLTPEQVEIIKHYWNDEKIPQEVREFWNHVAHGGGENEQQKNVSAGFIRLWQVMHEIYTVFQCRLTDLGLHTSGMAYRKAANTLKECGVGQLPFKRYIFVGFNNLSGAEKAIFAALRDTPYPATGASVGDFYWDLASPAFNDDSMTAGKVVHRYAHEFPSLYECGEVAPEFPEIEVIGISSRIGQAKAVSGLLQRIYPQSKTIDAEKLRKTAVVLPEENMLLPLLNSLPENLTPLNITMGYKLRNTAVAGLIRDIVSMQMRAYKSSIANTFFYEDVINVLSNPLVRSFRPLLCTQLLLEIQQQRLFNVPESLFAESRFSGLEPVFRFIADKNRTTDVFAYLSDLLKWLSEAVRSTLKVDENTAQPNDEDDECGDVLENDSSAKVLNVENGSRSFVLQEAFLKRYESAIARLRALGERYLGSGEVFLENATVFNLVERLVEGETLNFDGVPLKGLQIMGVLESRSLDFDTLFLPSMNEKVFPRARFSASFIPSVLRKAYHLPTPEDEENVYAYFFYRMIARAKKVYLLYDARATGLKSRQPSRYIHQLVHIFKPKGLRRSVLPYRLTSTDPTEIKVEKTPEIMAIINRYRSKENPLYLSASSIKQYVSCPMSFYLEKIAHYRREDDMNEWMDESTYGTIVHEVFERLYGKRLEGREGGAQITAQTLEDMRSNVHEIDRLITETINLHYRKLGEGCLEPLSGDTKLIGLMIKEYVREVLRKEQKLAPFTYLNGEWREDSQLKLVGSHDNEIMVNFTCRIDRIDRYIGDGRFPRVRIIDYKTGADAVRTPLLSNMFTDSDKKAFLQLMLYAQAYAQFKLCSEPIQPMIYSLRKIMTADIEPLIGPCPVVPNVEFADMKKNGKRGSDSWYILDYKDYVASFNDLMIPYLEELFDASKPFVSAEDEDACKFCSFKSICRKADK